MSGYNRRYWIPKNPDAYLASAAAMPPPAPRVYYPRELLAPGYLRRGYGGSKKWPFSKEKAFREPGYQRGIRNAVRNPAYARPWRTAAARRLEQVEEMERAEEERRIWEASAEAKQTADAAAEADAVEEQVDAAEKSQYRRLGEAEYYRNQQALGPRPAYMTTRSKYGVGKIKRWWQ